MRASYLLVVHLSRSVRVEIASRIWCLEWGYYVYVGSAHISRPYLRISRHLTPYKRARWHIDYLTLSDFAKPLIGVVLYGVSEDSLYQAISRQRRIQPAIPKFGASDRKDHVTHLFKVESTNLSDITREFLQLARSLNPYSIELVSSE
ncbi:MAG: DUF123 domain-containing protein [Sulfolobales archaeon]|nr:DUF123 domain-containing protein [Sulfolobales archaeon]MDW8083127.1 DUF123 domain-containing protein [Sulfolobales archaeon]